MAKALYGTLFDWIVLQVNHALAVKQSNVKEVLESVVVTRWFLRHASSVLRGSIKIVVKDFQGFSRQFVQTFL